MSVTIDIDLRDQLGEARDQGARPTCLVFAVSSAHEARRSASEYFSPEFLFYSGAQRSHKNPRLGLTPDAVRAALLHDGQPPETAWPYASATPDESTWKPPPLVEPLNKATVDFAPRTIAEVRSLLSGGNPVLLVVALTLAMYLPDQHGVVRARVGDKVTGRHALLAVGSGHADDGDYLLVRNSWGQAWGQAGHGWLHDPYLAPQLNMTATTT